MDWRKIQTSFEDVFEIFTVVRDAAASAAEREAGPQDHGVPDARGELKALVDVIHELRLRQVETDLAHRIFEPQALFRSLDGSVFRAYQFDSVFIEHAFFG